MAHSFSQILSRIWIKWEFKTNKVQHRTGRCSGWSEQSKSSAHRHNGGGRSFSLVENRTEVW